MTESLSQSELSTLMASEKRGLEISVRLKFVSITWLRFPLYFTFSRKTSNGIYPTNILSARTSVWESMAIQETEEVTLTPESQQHSRRNIQI